MQITDRAKEILDFIIRFRMENGAPPTIREIGASFGIRSTNGVCYFLDMLQKSGAIERKKGSARGIILNPELISLHDLNPFMHKPQPETDLSYSTDEVNGLPILGQIAAGGPVLAEENIEGVINQERLGRNSAEFALRVTGESMRDAGILDGDLVMVKPEPSPRQGEIVVAMIGDETTVKRFRRQGNRVVLEPENPAFEPIVVTARSPKLRILGKVVGVYREFR